MKFLKIVAFIGMVFAMTCLAFASAMFVIGEMEAAAGWGLFGTIYMLAFSVATLIVCHNVQTKENKKIEERLKELESKINEKGGD